MLPWHYHYNVNASFSPSHNPEQKASCGRATVWCTYCTYSSLAYTKCNISATRSMHAPRGSGLKTPCSNNMWKLPFGKLFLDILWMGSLCGHFVACSKPADLHYRTVSKHLSGASNNPWSLANGLKAPSIHCCMRESYRWGQMGFHREEERRKPCHEWCW